MVTQKLKPRGLKALLPHGGLPEVVTPYMLNLIERTGGATGPIGLQFIARPRLEGRFSLANLDPLEEDNYEITPGAIYKYRGRVNKKGEVTAYGRILLTATRSCATYCRFCTRGREVGLPPGRTPQTKGAIAHRLLLSPDDLQKIYQLLKDRKEINEVIISGGDPLIAPRQYLTDLITNLAALQKQGHIDIIRLGTRLPIHDPGRIEPWHYKLLSQVKSPYLMLHVNHPAELTPEALKVLEAFRKKSHATILAQTVFLKGVNDNADTLHTLFTTLTKEGIRPYYLLHNDPVYWAKHFTVPKAKALKIWRSLRSRLSGICATARFIIDVGHGHGKVVIPEGKSWDYVSSSFRDFKGKSHPFI